jgi:F-type H+-transporting ATPase subunit a
MFQTSDYKRVTKVFGLKKILISALVLTFAAVQGFANPDEAHGEHKAEEEKFNAGEMIMHHIADAHNIHFMTLNAGTPEEKHVSINLPIILFGDNGMEVMGSGKFYHHPVHVSAGHAYEHGNYIMVDEVIYKKEEGGEHGLKYDEEGAIVNAAPLDLSITKTVVGILLTTIIILLLFIPAGRAYKKNGALTAPKGIQSLLEPLIVFVNEQIIIPSVGGKEKAAKFTPFLLSVFFFIWIANLLGLMSFIGGYNVMGSISVTLVLATFVLIITNINGNKHYWKHIVWPDGVPAIIKILILVPIELVQIVLKPAVLMIRLTANITAGHIIILAFTALIFIFGQNSVGAGVGVGIGATAFMVFMFLIELLVAFLQAYVFTLLSALYFGSAVEDAHH